MTYFEGFVVPVPEANKEAYRKQAADAAPIFQEFGVKRHFEAWDSDVPEGKVTDFRMAVDAKPDEKVVFSWFEYPDKATRDAANEKMMSDPRMKDMGADMPFDGKRMIMGGFDAIVEEGSERGGYTDGFVVPVPEGKTDAYQRARLQDGQGVPPAWREPGGRGAVRRRAEGRSHRLLSRREGRGRREGRLLLHRMARQGNPRQGLGSRSWPTRA